MKRILNYFFIAALTISLVSCNKDPQINEADGSYTLEENSLKVNGTPVALVDMDQASVTITNTDEQMSNVVLNNIVLGIPSVTVPCSFTATKSTDFSFMGSATESNVLVDITGTIADKKIVSLEVNTSASYGIEGRWMIGEQSEANLIYPDINFYITAPEDFTPIVIGDIVIPGEYINEIVDPLLLVASTKLAYGYIEFTPSGLVNFSFGDPLPESMAEYADLIALITQPGLIQYYVENGYIMFNLRKSIADMLNMVLAQQGVSLTIPSPLVIGIPYTKIGDKLTCSLNQDYFKPYVQMLSAMVAGMTYEGLITMIPDLADDVDAATFELIKGVAIHVIDDLLLNSATKYSLTSNWIPYVAGQTRPWANYDFEITPRKAT